jgi:hypothetical protein
LQNEERYNRQDYASQLAIHAFHDQEGKMKNKGPDGLKGRFQLNKVSNLQSKADVLARSLEASDR